MDKIKIAVLDPTGTTTHEMEIDWSADQVESFLSSNRIVAFVNGNPIHFVSENSIRNKNPNQNGDGIITKKW